MHPLQIRNTTCCTRVLCMQPECMQTLPCMSGCPSLIPIAASTTRPKPACNPPSPHAGRISEQDVIVQIWTLLGAGIGTAFLLDQWSGHITPTLTYLAIFGSFISYIYSAPPLKLKQSGWAGNYALGASYIALPWWAGQVRLRRRMGCRAACAAGLQGCVCHGCRVHASGQHGTWLPSRPARP